MTNVLKRFLCSINVHLPPPGIDPRTCIRWACACGHVSVGGYGVRR